MRKLSGLVLGAAATAFSCSGAPKMEEAKPSADDPSVAAVRSGVAKKRALAALLPAEPNPHEGRQNWGSHVRCDEVDPAELEARRGYVLERVAAQVCANAARVLCPGANITEQQTGSSFGAGKGKGRVRTECVREVSGAREFGTLYCRSADGAYDEADGEAAVVCTDIDYKVE